MWIFKGDFFGFVKMRKRKKFDQDSFQKVLKKKKKLKKMKKKNKKKEEQTLFEKEEEDSQTKPIQAIITYFILLQENLLVDSKILRFL